MDNYIIPRKAYTFSGVSLTQNFAQKNSDIDKRANNYMLWMNYQMKILNLTKGLKVAFPILGSIPMISGGHYGFNGQFFL